MAAVLALLAFVVAFIFHGAGFNPGAWFNWQGLAVLGLVFVALHLLAVLPDVAVIRRNRPQPPA